MKVLFQATNRNTFRATLVGYLYEIAQKHQVVLFTEDVDSWTKKILGDKNLFPGLEKIIFFDPPFYGDIFQKNYQLSKMSKKLIKDFKPDIVITPEDIWPMSLYLLRFAKEKGILTLALQDGFRIAESKKLYLWSCLTNSNLNMPDFLPLSLRMLLVKMKKHFGHFLYYWILPLTAGQMPFLGKTSFVFWDMSPGLRDADYSAVFSKRDYDLAIKDGVPSEKLFILGHSLEHKVARELFEKAYFADGMVKAQEKAITIMWPEEKIGFKEDDYSLIPEDKIREARVRVVRLMSEKLAGWTIFVKPHPSEKQFSKIKEPLGAVANVAVVEPSEPADKYIAISKVIVGFSPPSTALFTASLQSPEKIILYIDTNREFLGGAYKNFPGIEYISSEEKLAEVLDSVRKATYQRKQSFAATADFPDASELISYIYDKRLY